MDVNESVREAERILHAAGWQEAPGWQGYTHGPCVGGVAPDGTLYVKSLDMVKPSDPRYGPDTPDEHHEAAARLVEHAKARAPKDNAPAAVDTMLLAPEPEQAETPRTYDEATAEYLAEYPDESDGETGEASSEADRPGVGELSGADDGSGSGEVDIESGSGGALADAEPLDADFDAIEEPGAQDELLEDFSLDVEQEIENAEAMRARIEGQIEDFAPDEFAPQDDPSGAFIFGDNLHQMRTAAIGLVVQAAIERLPEGIDYARLAELRNFVMGVSEGRWADDTAKRDELDTLEATERRRRAVEAARDEKVAFLVEATREQIEAFDPSEGWPE